MLPAACVSGLALALVSGCNGGTGENAAAKQASCPAPGGGAGADDVTGIRLGMNLATAKTLLSCRNGAFHFYEGHAGFRLPALPDGKPSLTMLTAKRGKIAGCDPADPSTLKACTAEKPSFEQVDEEVRLYLAGLPGKERVIAVMREEQFPADAQRDIAVVERDLVAKYGQQPDRNLDFSPHYSWIFDSRGQRISAQNPDFAPCRDTAGFGNDAPLRLREGCRRTVNAWMIQEISTVARQQGVAAGVGVALVDHDAALRAIKDAEAQISALAETQQRQEQQRAAAQAGKTTL
ncbi:hypothetical protein [Sphingomonas pituitosa]|uniref:hypothetical protein n=1 Tax=Sphingomonas pituitosa TaxID=99597 RepID=UPI000A560B3A|nr:hypothetical protein [Sphingomonas pituitosa]